ncbi:MAG: hypothetical protein P1V51_06165 [Deltaproteobacteria bacterium]|nr:hypothetical protein [Deltaproteobacteria bacterium]
MKRFATATAFLAALAMIVLPQTATAQFVPPDSGGDSGYQPPPPPPPAPSPTTTSTSSTSADDDDRGDRPLSYSERMKLKQEEERKAKMAEKAEKRGAVATGEAGPVTQTRPTDFSIGFGAGWIWTGWTLGLANPGLNGGGAAYAGPGPGTGTDILTPNTASARIRFGESVALEPAILLGMGNARQSVDVSGGSAGDTLDKWDGYGAMIDLNVRYGFMHRAKSSALLIFGAGFGVAGIQVDPEGADNITRAMNLGVNINFGIGAEWFITPHLALSGDMINPLISVRNFQTNDPNTDVTTGQGTLDLALNFQPGARLMFHVYY